MTAAGAVSETMQPTPNTAFQFIGFGFLGYWIQPFGCTEVKIIGSFVYFNTKTKIG
jgi:hypothetical protein